ncbi:MAG TPA: hypothetical protein VEX86_22170 [Longimicrobium sp.]|nr:hypothetical protein [Longimicrobium sp.]
MPTSLSPDATDELARLNQELAAIARATAVLLIQRGHDRDELAALDLRARELRAEIRALEAAAEQNEPVVLACIGGPAPRPAGEEPPRRKTAKNGRARRG